MEPIERFESALSVPVQYDSYEICIAAISDDQIVEGSLI